MDVADWLRALGLERYEATFRENDVDAELLPDLTADDLKDLGVTSSAIAASCWRRSPLAPQSTPVMIPLELADQPDREPRLV